ncbi:MAG: von Willebrand factor type A domain-containing protein [Alphaproteobacteria bacterium]|nr:von Willebrand factor type A domain-containing protein [Alphaproteobacteria bacterium]MCB9697043.1 von Willebrand factor type A domain-containing protein [Alphaproteobacteria bacterium]
MLGICLFASASAWAGLTTGSVQILVEDDDGLTVPGATVELSCENLIGGAQTLVTDANGQVTFVELPPGVCDARIVRDAFENVTVQGLRIDINRLSVQRVAMKAGSSTEIVVEARRPHADVTSTTAGTILTREFLNSVPMARSYQSAVQLAAGVTGGAGGNPNIGGGAYNENTYMREGAYISVPVAGGAVAPNAEQYDHPGFHGTESTAVDRLSTFAIDVDTASYALARVKLRQGQLPDTASVRVEEFVNAFPYDLGPGPRTGAPLGIHTEVAQHPLRQGSVLLSVALQSRQVPTERKPLHLTFLVDVSGSMSSADKIGLVRDSLHRLTDGLGAEDEVAIVTYAGSTQVVLEPTWTTRKGTVHDAIDRLRVGGGTAMGDGLDLAYGMAERMYRDGVENRVIVLTDGDANVGRASTDQLQAIVAKRAGQGIGLSVVGVGQGNYKDARLEQLADKGDGNYHYVDSVDEAARVFGRDLVANLTTLARDVKVQLEFPEESVVACGGRSGTRTARWRTRTSATTRWTAARSATATR